MVAEGVVPEGDPTKSASSKSVEMDAALGAEADGSRPFSMPEILVDLKHGGEATAGISAFMGGIGLRSVGAEGSRMDEILSTSVEYDSGYGDGSSYDSLTDSLSKSDDAFAPTKKCKCSTQDGCSSECNDSHMEESNNVQESYDSTRSHDIFCNLEENNAALDEYHNIAKMTFPSEDDCYRFYNNYARRKGFSVRKNIVRRENRVGVIFYRRYVALSTGYEMQN